MRTLKKTLCLVLVLAMMVGLCAVGASAAKLADYPDKDSIKNTQAVALLSALGILEGDERGFRPNDTLTRAEGAAIMTRLFNTTGIGTSSYTDMASAAWAQPYVAYCEAQGIIAGYGDGRFGPQDTLTVAQFAKMLLTALGYKANIEGLTGAAWEINVVKLINKIDLAHGLADLDYNAAITRDQAAQMAFTALKSDMVDYDSLVKVTTGDGTQVEVGANANIIDNTAYDYTNTIDGDMQFIETYFPTVKISKTMNKDRFGIPTNYWFKGDDRTDDTWTPAKALCDAPSGDVIKTYTNLDRVNYGTIFTDAALLTTTNVKLVENGADNGTIPVSKGNTTSLARYSGATGLLVKQGSTYTLFIKYPFLAQVTAIVPATESTSKNREVALKVTTGYDTSFTANFETESFAKRDYVLVYPSGKLSTTYADNTAILAVEAAEATTGTVAAYASNPVRNPSGVTLDQTAYSFSALGFLGMKDAPTLNKDATVYLSNGYVMGMVAASSNAADFVFVLGNDGGSKDAFNNTTINVGYLKQDASTATAVNFTTTAPANNQWYTLAAKGAKTQFNAPDAAKFTQTDAAGAAVTNESLKWSVKASQPAIATGITANNNTTFIIKSGIGTYATYAGLKNIPTFSGTAASTDKLPKAWALIPTTGSVAAVVFIDLTGFTAQDASVSPIYLLSTAPSSTREVNGVTYHTYSVIKDGALTTVQDVNGAMDGLGCGLITPAFNADGYVTRAEKTTSNVSYRDYVVSGDVSYAGGVLNVGGNGYVLSDNVAVYVYNPAVNLFALISGADAEYLVGKAGSLALVRTSATNTAIKEIYFHVGTTYVP
ncbi:MAG: S-layer homology domain-containing protein [Ruminococcaceae bacterium]|jgi:hypothetical protein|nr:S-layer homology domain-containing protein [Oscillospiraceae bacterium]